MKNRKFVLLIFLFISVLSAKEIIVEKTTYLHGDSDGAFFFPNYSHDGQSLFFTEEGYRGLWSFDLNTHEAKQLSHANGAGFHPLSLEDGSVIFRSDNYRRGRKYTALYRFHEQETNLLLKETRFLASAGVREDKIITLANRDPLVINTLDFKTEPISSSSIALINDQLSLQLLRNGALEEITPLGKGNYIWGALSPLANQIVFTQTGQGTYISDLEGKQLIELGEAHSPQWSPDGQLIVYMKDLDDGNQYTASEIWVVTADGTQSWMITNTSDRIEMYPQWSPGGQKITYHTMGGEIFETSIRIVE